MTKRLIVIQGPTASGKTALAIALAQSLGCEILSADSRQFYREVGIGTAKPTQEEQAGIPHHFIDSHSLETPVSASQFEREGLVLLNDIFTQQDNAILVGGSGLFIDALCDGLDDLPNDKKVQLKWEKMFKGQGIQPLQEKVKEWDPVHFHQMDQQNPHRLIRALEIMELSGQKLSDLRTNTSVKRPFETLRFVLSPERELLYQCINQRVLEMIDQGLETEVKSVAHLRHLQSLNTVGYKEMYAYLDGEYDLPRAIELIQQNTRRYAKRQLTWFRRNPKNIWIEETDLAKRMKIIQSHL